MARMIIPVPVSTQVLVIDLVAGDWIADAHTGPWHHVLSVTDGLLTVGEDPAAASSIPVSPGATALRLAPADAPRRLYGPSGACSRLDGSPSSVQTPTHDTDTKINDTLPGESDNPRSL